MASWEIGAVSMIGFSSGLDMRPLTKDWHIGGHIAANGFGVGVASAECDSFAKALSHSTAIKVPVCCRSCFMVRSREYLGDG